MQWSTLLYLACPIMMIFCMIGMRQPKDTKKRSEEPGITQQEVRQLQIKMAELMEQNQQLSKGVQTLKASSLNNDRWLFLNSQICNEEGGKLR